MTNSHHQLPDKSFYKKPFKKEAEKDHTVFRDDNSTCSC